MKICGNCGASNPDAARFCNDCGSTLPEASPGDNPPPATSLSNTSRKAPAPGQENPGGTLLSRAAAFAARRRADVMFVLDCTGSMQGEIDAIKDAIIAFANTIESDGVRVRVGMVEFRDRLIGEEPRVLTFDGEPFTHDPAAFRRQVSMLRASGGGDEPESSLDALMLALSQPFAPEVSKVLVLVTDAPPHIPDRETRSIEEAAAALHTAGVQQLHLVIHTQDPGSRIYLKLLESTPGLAFELGKGNDFRSRAESFKRTLMSLGKTISTWTR